MSVTINYSKNTSAPWQSNANMLKSTRDVYKRQGVAEAAAQAGADLINDIWGLKYDARMAEVIAKSGLACCLMHNRDNAESVSYTHLN